jgi:hypothetical protein
VTPLDWAIVAGYLAGDVGSGVAVGVAVAIGIAAAVAASSRGALAGFVGMFSCVGCMLPIIGAVAGLFGGSGAAASAVNGNYDIGTAVFASTVVLLLVTIPTTDPFGATDVTE